MDSAPEHGSPKNRQFYLDAPSGPAPFQASKENTGSEPGPLSATGFPTTRTPGPGAAEPRTAATPLWLMRLWVVIRVAFFIELGMVLVVLPWTRGWTENSFLLAYPELRFFLQKYFVRGLISGLGVIDIGFGISEALRYKEPPRNPKPS